MHEEDFTFALVVPRGERLATERPTESYRLIHHALADALRTLGLSSSLAGEETPVGQECFARPVRHDLVAQGRKIAGGAQRRTSSGLLHQGSVQGGAGNGGEALAPVLARSLSDSVESWVPPDGLQERILTLTGQKYASGEFLRGWQPRGFTEGCRS